MTLIFSIVCGYTSLEIMRWLNKKKNRYPATILLFNSALTLITSVKNLYQPIHIIMFHGRYLEWWQGTYYEKCELKRSSELLELIAGNNSIIPAWPKNSPYELTHELGRDAPEILNFNVKYRQVHACLTPAWQIVSHQGVHECTCSLVYIHIFNKIHGLLFGENKQYPCYIERSSYCRTYR